ncbi:MAG: hypothetical protein EOP22_08040 [Hyphomicrobiales bacterium]|nr:MAG: hypothetical protein EOP22_08040 [Hyphomicrobiales bacterium]
MLRYVIAITFAALSISAVAASDDVMCVQQVLTELGYAPGPADGAIGRRTREASAMFAADTGSRLPALADDNANVWCTDLTAFAASAEASLLNSPARALLPADVLIALSRQPIETGARLCKPSGSSLDSVRSVEPIVKISGFNSRMDNVESVEHARDLERFAGAFGGQSVLALASDNLALKTELIKILARWAEAGALLETIACVTGDGLLINKGACTEWTQDNGQDPSGMKDATFTTFIGAGLVRAYYAALADADPEGLAVEHTAIKGWIERFSKRLKRPGDVYFGLNMGWYWPTIVNELAAGETDAARGRLTKIADEMLRLISADGSIRERTTRGNRALWYHFTSIDEIVVSMELMRAAGMTPPAALEEDLHRAVAVFIAGVKDHSTLDKWAKLANNSVYDGTQDWDANWADGDFAGTWLHIYPYRYAGTPLAVELRALVPVMARSATSDIDLGLGLGCIYNAAIHSPDALPAPDQKTAPPAELKLTGAMVLRADDEPNFRSYKVTPFSLSVDDASTGISSIEVMADFNGSSTPDNLQLLRLTMPRANLKDEASRLADFSGCDPISVRVDGSEQELRLAFGEEAGVNECVFDKMGQTDRMIWTAIHEQFAKILAASKDEPAREIDALYERAK